MSALQQILLGTGAAAGGGTDPYFANVVALLHFEGTNGSTTMTDVTGKSWTATGTAALSTTTAPFGTSSLRLAGGTSDYVQTVSTSADFQLGTADHTIECFARADNSNPNQAIVVPNFSFYYLLERGNSIYALYENGDRASVSASAGTWYHVAVVKASGVSTVYVNGVATATPYTNSFNISSSGKGSIGFMTSLSKFAGYVKEVRITKGVARYTAAFSPPTGPFPDS